MAVQLTTSTVEKMIAALEDGAGYSINRAVIGEQHIRSKIQYKNRVLDWHVMHYVHRGRIEREVGKTTQAGGPGSFFWMTPGTEHSFIFQPGTMHQVLQIKLEHPLPTGSLVMEGAEKISLLFSKITGDMFRIDPFHNRALFHDLATLFIEIARLMTRIPSPVFSPPQEHLIRKTIRERAGSHPTSSDLAGLLGLSRDHFSRMYKRSFGVSPRTHIMEEIMRLAALEINTGASVGATAERFGYDIYTFSRLFKKVHGLNPKRFFREHGVMNHG